MAVRGNMHIDTREIKVVDFKSEFKFTLRGSMEVVNVSHDINGHRASHFFSPCRRRSIWPLSSCSILFQLVQKVHYSVSSACFRPLSEVLIYFRVEYRE